MGTEHALNEEHVKLIRKAIKDTGYSRDYSAVLDWRQDSGYLFTLCCTERLPEGADPSHVWYRWEMPATGRFERYGSNDAARYVASCNLYRHDEYNGVKAILRHVAVGDELHIKFLIGNVSENLTKAGMSHDQCFLAHVRKGKVLAVALADDRVAPPGRYSALMADSMYTPVHAVPPADAEIASIECIS